MKNTLILPIYLDLWKTKLREGESFRVRLSGTSMLPFIKNGEEMEVVKVPPDQIAAGSVILYEKETPSGPAVFAHRVVFKIPLFLKGGVKSPPSPLSQRGEKEGGFITKADSVFSFVKVVPDEVIGMVQNSKKFSYRLYLFTFLKSLLRKLLRKPVFKV